MRSPDHSADHISSTAQQPSYDYRSPEDDLTLGQWMTFSWVSSLLSVGSKRQLDHDDIWSLGFEFQHAQLFQKFRSLSGSVLKRLLIANGLDVFITSAMAMIDVLASMYPYLRIQFGSRVSDHEAAFALPVLLQQLLRAMENPHGTRKAAITYALLSLLARFISFQGDAVSLWFERRSYERSRGEMITMLYQKTLSRKITASPPSVEGTKDDIKAPSDQDVQTSKITYMHRIKALQLSLSSLLSFCGIRSQTNRKLVKEPQPPASMGKILNLMR